MVASAPSATSGFSLPQLIALEEAIASGSDTVSYDGKSVKYRSIDDMMRVRGLLRRALGLDPSKSDTYLTGHDRGFAGQQFRGGISSG